jgi:hypothetical protein
MAGECWQYFSGTEKQSSGYKGQKKTNLLEAGWLLKFIILLSLAFLNQFHSRYR